MSQSSSDVPEQVLKPATVDDIIDKLGEDDDKDEIDLTKPIKANDKEKEPELDAEGKPKEEEEVDELKLLEEDLEEPDDEKLELVTPVARREILKVYPDLFKKFPYLEKAYYREQQYTELLPTIDDAKEAVESHKVLKRYTEDMVEKGNVSNVLRMIKDSNPDTFASVADNYMEHLKKVDESAFVHVQSNMIKNIILGMVEEAKSAGDDDLRTAALLLNKWAFNSNKFVPPQKLAKDVKPEDKSKEETISRREQEFNKRQLDSATSEVNTRVSNAIKGAIETNIDPNKTMTDYVRKNAIRDALEKVTSLIEKDTRFKVITDKLWDKAAKSNFSKESQDEIRKAFLSKAKSLLAPVIKSARNEALKGMGRKVKEDVPDDELKPERTTERRLSSDNSDKANLDSLRGRSSFEKLNALMGD